MSMIQKTNRLPLMCVWAFIAATGILFMGDIFAKDAPNEAGSQTSGEVGKDISKAIEMLSVTAETQTERVAEVLNIVKAVPNKAALSSLCSWLSNETPTKRRSAIYIIQTMTWDDPAPAFPPLRTLLKHQEAVTRGMAAMALAVQGDKDSYKAILGVMKADSDAYVRRAAAWAVGEYGDAQGVEPLRAAALDADPNVAANAKNALDRIAFLSANKGASGDAAKVVRGIFLISGSTPWQEERLHRARTLIESAKASVRESIFAQAAKSDSEAIRNSVAFARK
jgi:HEAT repeat protein